MNLRQLAKRQRKYASILHAQRKISVRELGMMLAGRLEYSPGMKSLVGWTAETGHVIRRTISRSIW